MSAPSLAEYTKRVLASAKRLYDLGFWVIPIRAKGETIRKKNLRFGKDPDAPEFIKSAAKGKEPMRMGWGPSGGLGMRSNARSEPFLAADTAFASVQAADRMGPGRSTLRAMGPRPRRHGSNCAAVRSSRRSAGRRAGASIGWSSWTGSGSWNCSARPGASRTRTDPAFGISPNCLASSSESVAPISRGHPPNPVRGCALLG